MGLAVAAAVAKVAAEGENQVANFFIGLSVKIKKLLLVNKVQADVVVAADGIGNFTKIMDAMLAAEDYSMKRFVIYIKWGVYKENVEIKKKKWNLMMVEDGIDATIISGNRNFMDGWITFKSATFDLFAGLVWNVAGYVAGIRVLLEDDELLGMGWSIAECLHWSVGVWLLEYSHWKRALLLEVKLKVLLLEYFH